MAQRTQTILLCQYNFILDAPARQKAAPPDQKHPLSQAQTCGTWRSISQHLLKKRFLHFTWMSSASLRVCKLYDVIGNLPILAGTLGCLNISHHHSHTFSYSCCSFPRFQFGIDKALTDSHIYRCCPCKRYAKTGHI